MSLKTRRLDSFARKWKAAKDRLIADGIVDLQPMSLSIGLPLIEASADESSDEIVDLWVRLLAAAMDPRRANHVRYCYIETIKRMDPTDALIFSDLNALAAMGDIRPSMRAFLAARLNRSENDMEVWFFNLIDLQCVFRRGAAVAHVESVEIVSLSPKGLELLRILSR